MRKRASGATKNRRSSLHLGEADPPSHQHEVDLPAAGVPGGAEHAGGTENDVGHGALTGVAPPGDRASHVALRLEVDGGGDVDGDLGGARLGGDRLGATGGEQQWFSSRRPPRRNARRVVGFGLRLDVAASLTDEPPPDEPPADGATVGGPGAAAFRAPGGERGWSTPVSSGAAQIAPPEADLPLANSAAPHGPNPELREVAPRVRPAHRSPARGATLLRAQWVYSTIRGMLRFPRTASRANTGRESCI